MPICRSLAFRIHLLQQRLNQRPARFAAFAYPINACTGFTNSDPSLSASPPPTSSKPKTLATSSGSSPSAWAKISHLSFKRHASLKNHPAQTPLPSPTKPYTPRAAQNETGSSSRVNTRRCDASFEGITVSPWLTPRITIKPIPPDTPIKTKITAAIAAHCFQVTFSLTGCASITDGPATTGPLALPHV
jgi:hypothetical protein